jgi:uncharacterized protein (TIGR01777 family)
MMKVVLAGASGLLGQALHRALTGDGHQVSALVRRPPRGDAEIEWHPGERELDPAVVSGADAVVCLSGVGVGRRRWTQSYQRAILSSRVEPVGALARAVVAAAERPSVYVTASAVGCYGDTGDRIVDESAPYGDTFLAGVCRQWEAAAAPAADAGIRTVQLRTGPVLASAGDLMKRLKPVVWLGVGGRLGSGRQYIPWISLDDHVRATTFLLTAPLAGPVNLSGPEPARNADLVATMARLMHRPAVLPVPAFALRAVLGGLSDEILLGQRAIPKRLREAGFTFAQPTLESALRVALERRSAA